MEMGFRYEVEVTVVSARDLKNVNWRHGDLKPYAVLWVDDGPKCSTRAVDLHDGDDNPVVWDDEKVVLPLPPSAAEDDAVLYIDVVHADAADGVKPIVGSARLPLRDVLDTIGGGKPTTASRTLRLKRPSGRPHGRLDVRVAVVRYYYDPTAATTGPYPAAPYDQPPVAVPRDDDDPYYYGQPAGYPPADYGYGGGAPPQPAYGAAETARYGSAADDPAYQKKNSSGRKMGLAVGAAAGVLGGLALAGGASYLEHKLEENVAEDLAARDDDDDYDY